MIELALFSRGVVKCEGEGGSSIGSIFEGGGVCFDDLRMSRYVWNLLCSCLCVVGTSVAYKSLFEAGLGERDESWTFLYTWDDGDNFVKNELFLSDNTTCRTMTVENLFQTSVNVFEPCALLFKVFVFRLGGCRLDSVQIRSWTLGLHLLNSAVLVPAFVWEMLRLTASAGDDIRKSHTHYLRVVSKKERGREIDWSLWKNGVALCMSSVVFAVHPVNVEVIGWPSGQPYALATTLGLLSGILFARGTSPVLGACLYFCAAMTKAAMIPFVVILCCVYVLRTGACTSSPRSRLKRFSLGSLVTSILPSVVVCMVALSSAVIANADGMDPNADILSLDAWQRLLRAPMSGLFLLRNLFVPTCLRPHYRFDLGMFDGFQAVGCACLVAFVCVHAVINLLLSMKQRSVSRPLCDRDLLSIVVVATCAQLLPVVGLVPHGIVILSADRYGYAPLAVIFIPALAVMLRKLLNAETARGWTHLRCMVATGMVLYIGLLTSSAQRQLTRFWVNETMLYDNLIIDDALDWRALDMRAEIAFADQDFATAQQLWQQTQQYAPPPESSDKAALLHAKLEVQLGQIDSGCSRYEDVYTRVKSTPKSSHFGVALNNAAVCRLRDPSRRQESLEMFSKALEVNSLTQDRVEKVEANLRSLKSKLTGPWDLTLMY